MSKRKGPGGGRPGGHQPGKRRRPTGEDGTLWVISDRDALTDVYFPAIICGDRTWSLSREGTVAYVQTLLEVIGRANYDAGVTRQLHHGLGLPLQEAVQLVMTELRPDRPEIDFTPTKPLSFRPGVNKDLLGFVDIFLDEEHVGQMRAKAAYRHAMWVLEVLSVCDLDAQYLRLMRTIDPERATTVVDDVANYRAELW
jgi:hypothetical protein